MPGWIFKEGKFIELQKPSTMVNGQIKTANVYTKVDNEIRLIYGDISTSDILGFKLIYRVNKNIQNETLSYLIYNPYINHSFVTTTNSNSFDTKSKGVIYEYFDSGDEEGILCYQGILYAVLRNNMLLDVLNTELEDLLDDVLITNREEFELKISYQVRYECKGFNTFGWNSIFSKEELLPQSKYFNDKELRSDINIINDRMIYPLKDTNFRDSCLVGIARDVTVKDYHMIGSSGKFSHTINQLLVNDIPKPFTVEVFK